MHVFVIDNETTGIYYFGLTKSGVDIAIQKRLSPFNVDIAGSEPIDHFVDGMSATVTTEFARWNYATYLICASTGTRLPAPHDGTELPGEVGTLLAYESKSFQLVIVFPYSLKLAYASQPVGYRFYNAAIEADNLPQTGARPLNLRLTWKCWRGLDMGQPSGSIFGPGIMTLYDRNVLAANLALIT